METPRGFWRNKSRVSYDFHNVKILIVLVPTLRFPAGDMLNKIRLWLSPPEYTDVFEHAKDIREEGTGTWLLDVSAFKVWLSSDLASSSPDQVKFGNECLWIQGER